VVLFLVRDIFLDNFFGNGRIGPSPGPSLSAGQRRRGALASGETGWVNLFLLNYYRYAVYGASNDRVFPKNNNIFEPTEINNTSQPPKHIIYTYIHWVLPVGQALL